MYIRVTSLSREEEDGEEKSKKNLLKTANNITILTNQPRNDSSGVPCENCSSGIELEEAAALIGEDDYNPLKIQCLKCHEIF